MQVSGVNHATSVRVAKCCGVIWKLLCLMQSYLGFTLLWAEFPTLITGDSSQCMKVYEKMTSHLIYYLSKHCLNHQFQVFFNTA